MGRGQRKTGALKKPAIVSGMTPDGKYITGTGQVIGNLHPRNSSCDELNCAIHNPSAHHMDDLPTHLRDRGLMERICEHGVGHPDPDSLAYFIRIDPSNSFLGTHGCDGCCIEEARTQRDTKRKVDTAITTAITEPATSGDSLTEALHRPRA
jgi:hypothetical protein